jgi:hypothetical protein
MLGVAMINDPFIRNFMGNDFCQVMELMDICTGEAERAGVLSSMPKEAFFALKPGDAFMGVDTRAYRHHVVELLGRYKAGTSLQPGTEAEVLLGLVETSRVAPLNQGGAALYHRLFRRVIGPEAHDQVLEGMTAPRERWDGQTDELLHEARPQVRSGRPKKVSAPQLELIR